MFEYLGEIIGGNSRNALVATGPTVFNQSKSYKSFGITIYSTELYI